VAVKDFGGFMAAIERWKHLGVALALRMIPQAVLAECREKARAAMGQGKPTNWAAAAVIIAIWLLLAALAVMVLARAIRD